MPPAARATCGVTSASNVAVNAIENDCLPSIFSPVLGWVVRVGRMLGAGIRERQAPQIAVQRIE